MEVVKIFLVIEIASVCGRHWYWCVGFKGVWKENIDSLKILVLYT